MAADSDSNRGNAAVPAWPGRKKFAVGYFFPKPGGTFSEVMEPYLDFICEVYHPWPGLLSARQMHGDLSPMRTPLTMSLLWCRKHGLQLDLLLNATCYGEDAATLKQRDAIVAELRRMDGIGVFPDIVTTTSPFAAKVIRDAFPQVELRASVNMRIDSTLALEYIADLFDSFYICRDLQRDLDTLKLFGEWADDHGKKLCMLANSGCLRNCPWQVYHETLLSHRFEAAVRECDALDMPSVLCAKIYRMQMFEEVLRGSWIRPEDLYRYAPHVSVIKLSTRDALLNQRSIMNAYTSGSWGGDLLELIDPSFPPQLRGFAFDNSAFPPEWSRGEIAGKCASDCTHCGKCAGVLKKVLKPLAGPASPPARLAAAGQGIHFTIK